MTGETRLNRTMWAAVAAALTGDDEGLTTLLDGLDDDDLLVFAGAAVQVIAGLLTRGCDPAEFLAVIREELARTAGESTDDR